MALRQGWLALALLGAGIALAVWRYAKGPDDRRRPLVGLRLAHTDRIRVLPRFQHLARRRLRWLVLDLCFVAVAVVGALVLVARPVAVAGDSREMRGRDVMLCLDVSGSMTEVDQVVIASYIDLLGRLQGERIGLVVWDSAGVMAFPLTDDYIAIEEQLHSVAAALEQRDGMPVLDGPDEEPAEVEPVEPVEPVDDLDGRALIAAARVGRGSSLIGDGLMSCLLRFDQRAAQRSRTVVLATDNQLAGPPIFTLAEAGERAVEDRILVMGITPNVSAGAQRDEFRTVVESTGGQLMDLVDDPAMEARIVHAIETQQRRAIMGLPDSRSFDQIWPGASLMAVGLLGMVTIGARGRR